MMPNPTEPEAEPEQPQPGPGPAETPAAAPVKKKRNLPGTPDPDAEVIALSPGTLLATNRFVCEVCGKVFQRAQILQLHRRGHYLPWRLRQRGPGAAPPRRLVYVCPEPGCVHHSPACALGDLTGIKKHFCRKHGEKRWACPCCGKRYAVQADLKAHAKTCGTREYRCDCGTLFTRRDSFVTHRAFCGALVEETGRVLAVPAPPSPRPPDLEAEENVDQDEEKGEEEENKNSAVADMEQPSHVVSYRALCSPEFSLCVRAAASGGDEHNLDHTQGSSVTFEGWPATVTGSRELKICLIVVMFVVRIKARYRSRPLLNQYWTHASASVDELVKAAEWWPARGKRPSYKGFYGPEPWAKDLERDVSEVKKVVKRQRVASSQFRDTTPRKGLKKILNVVKFLVRIQAGVRGRQVREHYSTHGSGTTDELGKPAERWLAKGTGLRVSDEPEPWPKDLESDASEVTKVVRRQRLDKNVEKSHSTFLEDVKAWSAIKKQYKGGVPHTCVQQVGPKLLGRNYIKQMIMEKILLHRNGGSNYTVVCINAGSGHGKTSLLRVLYNDQQLTDAFDKRMWIQMSDKLDILMLFRKIVEFSMNDSCSITNLRYLQEMVEEEIADKKIALFLDDADIEDQHFWNSLLVALNAGARGSVIVMATRSATVAALRGVATHSYSLGPLSEENNLMLLQQYAAVHTDIQTNPDLLMVAKRMISRFRAHPLNLKAIGGLLCHTDTTLENDKFVSAMPLQFCHDVLPIHLKKCLAFCSLFPEGYIFDRHHLILLWICHGCVRPVEGCEIEDVGAEYFSDLLSRSFFQHSPFHDEKDEKFVMHELIYKVVEPVTQNKYFKSEDLMISVPEEILHLSLVSCQFQTVQLMPRTEKLKDLQTFLVVQPERYKVSVPTINLAGLDDFFKKFTSLETLDLSHTDIKEVPGSIASMRNLQYLSLNNTSIRGLPSELCSLSNLQTLKAKGCRFLTELPGDTKKLLKLRHLDVTKELDYVHLPHGVGQLTELRTLPVFHASGDSSHCCISELGNLHSLRGCLRISGLESVKTGIRAQDVNLKDKEHLKELTLQWHDGGTDIDVDDEDAENVAEQVLESLEPHSNVQELTIRGYEGSAFPAWMQGSSSLPSLVSLILDGCCNCTKFPAVTQLPSLKFLSVRKMYDVQQLSSDVHGATKFPSLEVLNLWEMYGLEELLEASEGDCPRLHKICVSRCPDLKRLPCIRSVNELVLHCCHQLPDIPELASLTSLKIEGLHGVKSFSLPLLALPVLKKLEIRSCNELSSVHGVEALTTVQRLKIAGCPKFVLPRTSGVTSSVPPPIET